MISSLEMSLQSPLSWEQYAATVFVVGVIILAVWVAVKFVKRVIEEFQGDYENKS
jgi:hypothetical protein